MLNTYYSPDDHQIFALGSVEGTPGYPRLAVHLTPGALVRHARHEKSCGVLIANGDDFVTVLWSVPPGGINFSFPAVRQVGKTRLIANQLISVQPMTVPAGGVFYIDYTYGSGSAGKV